MSPERIRNENYSYAADIWSLGLTILECATGKFPYDVNEGPANLMLQVSWLLVGYLFVSYYRPVIDVWMKCCPFL
jgi:serine/threonine protein kinase